MTAQTTAIKSAPMRIRLTLDRGLAAYVRALVASPVGIFGDERETLVYMIRTAMLDKIGSQAFREAMMPYLPEEIQEAWRRK